MRVPELFGKMAELAAALGVSNIKEMPGCWLHKVDDRWTIAVNAHREPCNAHPEGGMDVDVPPFTMAVWWNGWLAGLVDAAGGEIAAHPDGANEDRLLSDMDAAIARARA